ncbi:alpha/beta fold hydrolase [Egicoccus sp. AB-alg2]|uniref:alpha/beta fold hydrolase n=1 Tax=Egicoccus sp. AB-alg2 TaxID=3242693 RepID=UPI00359E4521
MLVSGAETLQGVDGERHVASWSGPDVDRVVLVCHSLREHVGLYEELAEALVRSGAHVYGLDQAGHGRSEGSPALLSDLENAVAEQRLLLQLARARHPGLPIVLLGHGTGATLAVRLGQQLGELVAALVLAAPLLGARPGNHLEDPRLSVEPYAARDLSRDPAVGGRFAADPLVWRGQLPLATAAALHRGLRLVDRGPRLRQPVLWLHGTADRIVPVEPTRDALRRLVPADRLTEHLVEGARHQLFTPVDRDDTVAAVTGFLAGALRQPQAAGAAAPRAGSVAAASRQPA